MPSYDHIEEPFVARLLADGTVSGIVGTRIRPAIAVQGEALPHITYQLVSNVPLNLLVSTEGTFNARMQFNLNAQTYTSVKDLANAVRASLSGFRDDAGTPSISGCYLESELDDFDDPSDDSEQGVFRVMQDYSVWYA